MSTGSEYRITTHRSRLRRYAIVLGHGLLLYAVFCWQPQVWPWQTAVQTGLTLLLLLSAIVRLRQPQRHQAFSVNEQGHWLFLDKPDEPLQIQSDSKHTALMLWIHLTPRLGKGAGKWCWIFRDAVPDADYRRLCRIIRRLSRITETP